MKQSRSFFRFMVICSFILSNKPVFSQQPVIGYQTVVGGLTNPVDIVNAGGSKLFIAQQNGIILGWDGSSLSTFLNLSSIITSPAGSEQGLLSIAFHPAYSSNGYFFVWYTSSTGAVTLARYQRDALNPDIANPSSGQILLSIPKPGSPYFTNHNGAKLIFGSDGMLYIGTGDGGSGGDPFNNAQSGNSLLGKMLRIDVNGFASSAPFYSIPPDNPFAASGDGILNEIYSFGLRNPWRWSFDRLTNDLWIADVGQDVYEEVNYRQAGSSSGINYGWRCREGMHNYNFSGCSAIYTDPVFEYTHNISTGGFSITGGYVYRGSEFASLYGHYIAVDYVSGNLWLLKPQGSVVSGIFQPGLTNGIAGFGEAADGTLYAVKRGAGNGALYKVIVTSVIPVVVSSFSAREANGIDKLTWTTSSEQNIVSFMPELSEDNRIFTAAGEVAASGNPNGNVYSFDRPSPQRSRYFYRLAIKQRDGAIFYSSVIRIDRNIREAVVLYSNVISNHNLVFQTGSAISGLEIFSPDGKLVFRNQLNPLQQSWSVKLPAILKGNYFLRFLQKKQSYVYSVTVL